MKLVIQWPKTLRYEYSGPAGYPTKKFESKLKSWVNIKLSFGLPPIIKFLIRNRGKRWKVCDEIKLLGRSLYRADNESTEDEQDDTDAENQTTFSFDASIV